VAGPLSAAMLALAVLVVLTHSTRGWQRDNGDSSPASDG
jgi:hypothetical protein